MGRGGVVSRLVPPGKAPSRLKKPVTSLKLARKLTTAFHTLLTEREAWETHWVPTTTFFFESEDTLRELVLQRRRWLNGTTAGYVWLISQPELWRGVRRLRFMSVKVLALALLQLLIFAITFIMPGLLHFKMHPTLDVRCWRNKPGKRFAACYEFGFSVFVMVLGALAMFFVVVTMGGHIMSEGAGHDALDPHNVDSHSGGSVEIGEGGWGWGRRAL